ncbi:MAG: Uncharacterised protein [Glaciecola sp. HTCC2999]|jgi:cytochrome oxidase assembly protein ShyY1|nr:MAG: Uncharacterised protein [Glaciecola sp. HTCC2999]
MPNNSKVLTIISHLIVTIVISILCSLGSWQIARYEDKKERVIQISERQAQGVIEHRMLTTLNLSDVRDVMINISPLEYSDKYLWLDNQQSNGQIGFKLVVPVNTEEGWLLVNMGWVKGRKDRLTLPNIPALEELTKPLTGAISIPGINRFVTETALNDGQFPKVIQQIEISRLGDLIDKPLLPYMLTVTQPSEDYIRQWTPVVMAPEKHIGYAIQWFGLAIAGFIIYFIAWRKKRTVQ